MQITYSKNITRTLITIAATAVLMLIIAAMVSSQQRTASANNQSCSAVDAPISSWLTQRINQNRAVYNQVASETGVPWAVLAAIHYREFNSNRSENPHNGQGIYQLYSLYNHPNAGIRNNYRQLAARSTPVTPQNFLEQTRIAANFIQEKARVSGTPIVSGRNLTANETNMNLIKSTLFSYNGRATAYANQAASYGFNPSTHPFEGSPYVMSLFDCTRASMGLITYDGGSTPNGVDTRMGAFTLYARLRGDAFWKNLQATSMQAASRVQIHTIKPTSDTSGDMAKVGFTLSRRPSHPVTLTYAASSPSNARVMSSTVTIQPANWNNASRNTIDVLGLNNRNLTGNFEYSLVPTRGPQSTDAGFRSVAQSQLPQTKLLQQDAKGSRAVYRLYSPTLQKHAFTASGIERQELIREGWRDEGSRFNYCTAGNQSIVKLHNQTTDEYRLALLNSPIYTEALANGFSYDKLDFGTSNLAGTPVYWRHDPVNNRSLYTTNPREAAAAPWVDKGVVFNACAANSQAAYRMYRFSNNAHFITTSATERNNLVKSGTYRYEGVSFYACSGGDVPVYRLYRPSNDTHFLTTSVSERNSIVRNLGFRYEGVAMSLCSNTERPVYRLFRPSNNAHFLTSSASERRSLSQAGFRDEGVKMNVE